MIKTALLIITMAGHGVVYENQYPTMEESEIGFENFCVIESKIYEMEWLYLAAQGHRRAKIFIKDNEIKTDWVTP